ncbi:MAG: flavin reductase [Actinobacteria bacterium]|jgi:flavin reductase (DIM6/NTAB) family NADH-FMN oxidoreductase RutF|nr:flavin reductase [Actinomycetota bacterium]
MTSDATADRIDPEHFRSVLGRHPTGVVVVTSLDEAGRPIGMTVGSFTSVSLDPPLVAFLPQRGSRTWAGIRARGSFCVNVLGAHQESVCRRMATADPGSKFDGVGWRPSAITGMPVIEDSVAVIDCTVDAVHAAGDHDIVVGAVEQLDTGAAAVPLVFYRGGYGSFVPTSLAAVDEDLLGQLRLVDRLRGELDRLAARLDTECTLVSLVRDQLILTASAGPARDSAASTRVGQRVPFLPPLGGVFAAWGGRARFDAWIAGLEPDDGADEVTSCRELAGRIRERGYVVALGHGATAHLESVSVEVPVRVPGHTPPPLHAAIAGVRSAYNPATLDATATYEFAYVSAPIFGEAGDVVLALSLYGPGEPVTGAAIEAYGREVTAMAAALSEGLAV